MTCDGCGKHSHISLVAIFMLNGAQVRYCQACSETWRGFDQVCQQEEARRQRLFELWIQEARSKVSLHLTPYDFPAIITERDGQPVTL